MMMPRARWGEKVKILNLKKKLPSRNGSCDKELEAVDTINGSGIYDNYSDECQDSYVVVRCATSF